MAAGGGLPFIVRTAAVNAQPLALFWFEARVLRGDLSLEGSEGCLAAATDALATLPLAC